MSNPNWLDLSGTSNRYVQMYVKGFVDVSGGNITLRPGITNNNHLIVQGGDISLNGRLFSTGTIQTLGAVALRNSSSVISPNTTAATGASWTNNNVTWTASASSMLDTDYWNAYKAFNTAYNEGESWHDNATGYTLATGVADTTFQTTVFTTGSSGTTTTYNGQWLQLQSSNAASIQTFYFATRTAIYNNRLPGVFYIVGSNTGTETWTPIFKGDTTSTTGAALSGTVSLSGLTSSGTGTILNFYDTTALTYTTYGNLASSFTYFRLIVSELCGNDTTCNIGEWGLTFTPMVSAVSLALHNTIPNQLLVNGITVGRGGGAIDTNTVVGQSALGVNTTGVGNSVFGLNSLLVNTTGSNNCAFGQGTLRSNTTGTQNSAFGMQTLHLNTTGDNNCAFGHQSLYSNATGLQNAAFGMWALHKSTTGHNNSAFGQIALYSNTTGFQNTAFGQQALYANTIGNYNTAIGVIAGSGGVANVSGSKNTYLGFNTGATGDNFSDSTAIGADARIIASNQIVLGTGNEKVYMPGNSIYAIQWVAPATVDGATIPQYGLSWQGSNIGAGYGPTGYLSAWGGLRFVTQGMGVMTITPEGKVGIGTTNPGATLQLTSATPQLLMFPSSTALGQTSAILFAGTFGSSAGTTDTGARYTSQIVSGFIPTATWTGEYLAFNVGSNGANDARNYSIERMRITGSGNVGIGRTDPVSILDIFTTTSSADPNMYGGGASLSIRNPAAGANNNASIMTSISGTDSSITTGSAFYSADILGKYGFSHGMAVNSSRYSFKANYNFTGKEVLTLLANGQVGIGTSIPWGGSTQTGLTIFSTQAGNQQGALAIVNTNTHVSGMISAAYGNYLTIGAYDASGNAGKNIYFGSNVGIGTTNPASTLEVAGAITAPDFTSRSNLAIGSGADMRIYPTSGYTLYLNNDRATRSDLRFHTGSLYNQTWIDNGNLYIENGGIRATNGLTLTGGPASIIPTSTYVFGSTNNFLSNAITSPPVQNGIFSGTGDSASSTTFNLAIGSWFGIGFVNTCTGDRGGCHIYMDVRSGTVNASKFNTTSDYRIKENVNSLSNSYTVDNLRPVSYYNTISKTNDIGFIAHEVQEHFPELVSGEKDAEDRQALNYTGLIGILTKEIQDLKKEVKELRKLVSSSGL